MKTETETETETKVYGFNELSDDAKQSAIERLTDINVDSDWYEQIFEKAKEIGKLMGIEVTKVYFSGFWSKGDGACFDGSYEYARGSVAAVKAYAPKDLELHRIAVELAAVQRRCFYQIRADIKQSGHYYHRYCTDIDVDFESHVGYQDYYTEEAVIKLLRDFMYWIYKQLKSSYDYLTSEAAIVETIKANGAEFTEAGEIFQK